MNSIEIIDNNFSRAEKYMITNSFNKMNRFGDICRDICREITHNSVKQRVLKERKNQFSYTPVSIFGTECKSHLILNF